MTEDISLSDAACRSFLDALTATDDVEVNDWETGFIESNTDRTDFSAKQSACIGRMLKKYGDSMDWQQPE